MKLKPQPLGWIAALCTAIFIFEGVHPVDGNAVNTLGAPIGCGSPWIDETRYSLGCAGSHVGAIIIMSLAAAVGFICVVLFAVLVLPRALRPEQSAGTPPSPVPQVPSPAATRMEAPRLRVPDKIPAGWHPHPVNPKLMRYWTGQTYGTVTRECRPDE